MARSHPHERDEQPGAGALLAQGTPVSPTRRCPGSSVSVVTSGVLVAVVFPWELGRKPSGIKGDRAGPAVLRFCPILGTPKGGLGCLSALGPSLGQGWPGCGRCFASIPAGCAARHIPPDFLGVSFPPPSTSLGTAAELSQPCTTGADKALSCLFPPGDGGRGRTGPSPGPAQGSPHTWGPGSHSQERRRVPHLRALSKDGFEQQREDFE